jgi:TorA maturation chaperone TorD
LTIIDKLCNRVNKEVIVQFFSDEILAYLYEYLTQFISKEQKWYGQHTEIALKVLKKVKITKAGTQEAIERKHFM